jgi:hypothetical protein
MRPMVAVYFWPLVPLRRGHPPAVELLIQNGVATTGECLCKIIVTNVYLLIENICSAEFYRVGFDAKFCTYLSIVRWTSAEARVAAIQEIQRRTDAESVATMAALRRMKTLFSKFQVDSGC